MIDQTSSRADLIKPTDFGHSDLETIAGRNLQQLANGSLILATVLLFLNLFAALQAQNYLSGGIVFVLFLLTFIAAFLRSAGKNLRAWLLILAFMGTGIASEMTQGINANGILYFFCAVLITALLLPKNRWVWILGASAVILIGLAIILGEGVLVTTGLLLKMNPLLAWVSIITTMIFLTFLVSSVMAETLANFSSLVRDMRVKETDITAKDTELNETVTKLEGQLDSRKFRMVAARQISREIAQQPNLEALLKESVELIRAQFGYYHAGIFLKDERNEFAVLKAATGEAGAEMLARKHQLRLREEGVVGFVVARGEVRIASDVELDAVHFRNPSLPLTKSEMAVPLRIQDQIIGALDVQSHNSNEFDSEDADVLQTIADTLASSIDKLSQIQTLKEKLADLEQKNRESTGRAWQSHLKGSRKRLNYRYRAAQTQATDDRADFYRETISTGKPHVAALTSDPGEKTGVILAVPIKLRDQVLGVVNIKYEGETLPDEMQTLVKTASDRLALALENARLLEEIQERAEREHLVADISDRVRAASDIDSILRTTATELGKSLGVAEVRIQLKTAAVD